MRRAWLLVLVALVPAACSDDDEPEAPLGVADEPTSYRITYELDDGTDEVLTVARPFESRIETDAATETTTFGRSSREGPDGARLAVAIPPGVAPGDARLASAIGTDVLERTGERKTIAGRPCDVYVTGQSLRVVELVAGDDVEVCIDASGLVLEERTDDLVRTATDVEVGVDASFDAGERTVPVLEGGGAVQALTADSRTPGEFWELGDDLPLPHEGRYAVVPPQPDAFTDATLRGRRVATTTDVLTDGIDVVVVDRGGTLEGIDVVEDDDDAAVVDAGAIGQASVRSTSFGTELTIELDGGRFVRISGTLPVDDLIAVARGLTEVPGGTLTPTGDPW
jgi:hypothetical protein